jgi:hypothetical protein
MTDRPKKHQFQIDEAIVNRLERDEHASLEFAPEERFLVDMTSKLSSSLLTNSYGKKVTSGFVHLLKKNISTDPEQYEMYVNVHSATIPDKWFNVNPINQSITVTEYTEDGNTSKSFELPRGNYTHEVLCNDLSYGLSSLTSNTVITVTHSTVTHAFYITAVSTPEPLYPLTITFPPLGMGIVMGFEAGQYQLYNELSILSNKVTDLESQHNLYIRSNIFTDNVFDASTGAPSDIIAKLQIKESVKGLLHYENNSKFSGRVDNINIDYLVMRLTDHGGRLMDLNGYDWSVTLEFIRKKKFVA